MKARKNGLGKEMGTNVSSVMAKEHSVITLSLSEKQGVRNG